MTLRRVLAVLAMVGCGGGAASDGVDAPAADPDEPALVTRSFTASNADIFNPERGVHDSGHLVSESYFPSIRRKGHSLVYIYIRLDDYRSRDLDAALLAKLDDGFAKVRAAGLKTILRVSYNHDEGEPDAPKAQVMAHIRQLKPLFQKNADVIYVVNAGFIGAWGEWHASTNNLTNPTDRRDIANALLDALPPSRQVMLRYLRDRKEIFPGELDETTAFTNTTGARLGHHNDCFLSNDSDSDTYNPRPTENWKAYLERESRYVAVGGEPCDANPPRSDCPTALAEMKRFHWSYVNGYWSEDVIDVWKAQGCWAEISRRIGYRLSLKQAAWSGRVRPGGILTVQVDLENTGWAPVTNPRPVEIVLHGTTRHAAAVTVDPRRWPAGVASSFRVRLRLPATIEPGKYRLGLALPDAAMTLRGRADYAIQLANDGVFDPATATNWLTDEVTVDATAPGNFDGKAKELTELR